MKKYLCGVTFQYELDCSDNYRHLFDSIEELKNSGICWMSCGIVEMDINDDEEDLKSYNSFKWVHPQDFSRVWPGDYVDKGTEDGN